MKNLILASTLFLFLGVGCTTAQLSADQSLLTQAQGVLTTAQQQLTQAQAVASTQPSNATVQTILTQAQATETKAESAVNAAQSAVTAMQNGGSGTAIATSISPLLALIPGIGGYATLIAGGIGLLYGVWQKYQAGKAAATASANLNTIAAAAHADAGSSNMTQALASIGAVPAPTTPAPKTTAS